MAYRIYHEGGEALAVSADVRSFSKVKIMFAIAAELGRVEIVINNAGLAIQKTDI